MEEFKYISNAINYVKPKSLKYTKTEFYLGFKKYSDGILTFQISHKKDELENIQFYFLNGKMEKYHLT